MVKYKEAIFIFLILSFLAFSFYPTIFELSKAGKLADPNREFILEHNYYWPDYNLYLSKVRQGSEGRLTALERYTSEPHQGSLIQIFYVYLGQLGRILSLNPNFSYQLGRVILSPLLLLVIILLITYYFPSLSWQILSLIIILLSGSFPRFYTDSQGIFHIGRYMEWWSNIDALQRITFIPHILFGQVISFFILYQLTTCNLQLTTRKLILLIFLGNAVGLVFPPSLITLDGVISLIILTKIFTRYKNSKSGVIACLRRQGLLFIIFTLPSLLYFLIITKYPPWSSLVVFHRTHPMMIPFWEYILGTGPIFFLGLAGGVVSIIKRDRKFQPLIFWILATFGFAVVFTHLKEQSPLRFTQTGLFIPLGILGTYFFQQVWLFTKNVSIQYFPAECHCERSEAIPLECTNSVRDRHAPPKAGLAMTKLLGKTEFVPKNIKIINFITAIIVIFYLLENLYMIKTSLDWQTTFIKQRVGANLPPVPYPPQTMYPLRQWMDGVRWLRDNTNHGDVVLAEITAGNHIPAYAGNTVYFGQSNTVDYERKQAEVWKFFKGEMGKTEAQLFLKNGRIKYIFYSLQEKEKSGGKSLEDFYPFLTPIYTNPTVTIFTL